jgi:hypothetical protein
MMGNWRLVTDSKRRHVTRGDKTPLDSTPSFPGLLHKYLWPRVVACILLSSTILNRKRSKRQIKGRGEIILYCEIPTR